MALNIFKNVTHNLSVIPEVIYTTPPGYTGIVLMAQITNVTSVPGIASMSILTGSVETFLAYEYEIPGNDSAGMLTGKLVLEPGQRIQVSGSDDSSGSLQMVMSILESQN